HSHTHTVLSILYPLAARQNKVCLEDKFPVARDHINILIPGLRPSALPRATNIPPRWGGGRADGGRWGPSTPYLLLCRLHPHSHTHTVLSILYPLAARQNKVCLEDKFPVARVHINILIPGLRRSALPRATNIPPRWGGGEEWEWLNRMDRRWRLCFCRWGLMCRDVLFQDARRASLRGDCHRLWIVHGTVSETRDRPGRWVPSTPNLLLCPLHSRSHTHTVLPILYPLAARQNKVCLEDKFP